MKKALLATLLLGSVPSTVRADTVSLDFSSLPSAQGWIYRTEGPSAAVAETDVFSVDGSRLLQNTLGIPTYAGGGNFYTHGVTLAPGGNFTLNVVATLDAFEGQTFGGGTTYPFGFIFGLTGTYFGIAGERLGSYSNVEGVQYYDFAGGFSPLGTHAYQLSRTGGVTTLTGDGTTLFSGMLGGEGDLLLGDGTGFANASGSYARFSFASVATPEPATWALLIAGFGMVGGAMRRKSRALA